tara:strand:+ start:11051 stop:11968 length:918 start_codon:yes stop_codon:yes gene_type:complete
MKFGKVHNIEGIKFNLPFNFNGDNECFLKGLNTKGNVKTKIFLGCPVWRDRSFIGKIYPKLTKVEDYLTLYAENFQSIELNSTYYALPSNSAILDWCAKVPKGFKFCPKIPGALANERNLGVEDPLLKDFLTAMELFGEHLGPLLLQLNPYFDLSRWKALVKFIRLFPKNMKLAVEFRHPEWFFSKNFKKLVDHMRAFGVILACTDVAGRRDVCHTALTSQQVMIRFTGNGLHKSDFNRSKEWAHLISKWLDQGLEEAFFFFHQPVEGDCVDVAMDFVKNFKIVSNNKEIRSPALLKETVQLGLF